MSWRRPVAAGLVVLAISGGCASPAPRAAPAPLATESPSATPVPVATTPSATPSATRKPTPKPTTTLKKTVSSGVEGGGAATPPTGDGVPANGARTFTEAPGGTDVVGTGTVLVKYRVEVENGIAWGANPVWTPAGFAGAVDPIIAAARGWTESGAHPITNAAEQMADASWAFQRVSGADYSVRIRLATPGTVDYLCGQAGLRTQGVYSCRFGQTVMINLRRWLKGAVGFPIDVAGYRAMVINHELGHFLGFDHMRCPGGGQPAPVMQTQTVALNGCTPNAHPYTEAGVFVTGPWTRS